jgi:hypothetical protein
MSDVYQSHKSIDGFLYVTAETRSDGLGKQVAADEKAMMKMNMANKVQSSSRVATIIQEWPNVQHEEQQQEHQERQVEHTSECLKPVLLASSPHCDEPVAKRFVDRVPLAMPKFGWMCLQCLATWLAAFAVLYKISSSPGYDGLDVKIHDAFVTQYASTLQNRLLTLEEEPRRSVNPVPHGSIASLAGHAMSQVFAISSDAVKIHDAVVTQYASTLQNWLPTLEEETERSVNPDSYAHKVNQLKKHIRSRGRKP